MPRLYSTRPLIVVPGLHLTNYCSVGGQTYQSFCKKESPEIRYNYENYVQELQSRPQSCYEVARANLKISKENSKDYYDRNINVPLFAIGEKVLLNEESVTR